MVEVTLLGNVDVRSFREDKNYIVDLAFQQVDKSGQPAARASEPAQPSAAVVPPDAAAVPPLPRAAASISANGMGMASPAPAKSAEAPRQLSPLLPPTSETIAKEANVEIRRRRCPRSRSRRQRRER